MSAICVRVSSRASSRPTIFCPPRLNSRANACSPSKQPTSAAYPKQTCSGCSAPIPQLASIPQPPSSRRGLHRSARRMSSWRRHRADGQSAGRWRIALERRESASPPRGPGPASGLDRRRVRLRKPEHAHLPALLDMGRLLGYRRQCDLGDLGRRPQPGGPGRGRRDGPRRRIARARFRSPGRLRGPAAAARSGLEPRRHRHRSRRRSFGSGGIPCRRRALRRGCRNQYGSARRADSPAAGAARSDKGARDCATGRCAARESGGTVKTPDSGSGIGDRGDREFKSGCSNRGETAPAGC